MDRLRKRRFEIEEESLDDLSEFNRIKSEFARLSARNAEIRKNTKLVGQKPFFYYYNQATYKRTQGKYVTNSLLEKLAEGMKNSEQCARLQKQIEAMKPNLPKHFRPMTFERCFVDLVKERVPLDVFQNLTDEVNKRLSDYNFLSNNTKEEPEE